jgi:hypothetical protein
LHEQIEVEFPKDYLYARANLGKPSNKLPQARIPPHDEKVVALLKYADTSNGMGERCLKLSFCKMLLILQTNDGNL